MDKTILDILLEFFQAADGYYDDIDDDGKRVAIEGNYDLTKLARMLEFFKAREIGKK